MYYTLLIGFNRLEAEQLQYNQLTTDNILTMDTFMQCPNRFAKRIIKVVIKDNFIRELSNIILNLQSLGCRGTLNHITFVDYYNLDKRHDVYTIRQGFTKLDEDWLKQQGYDTFYLLYLIESNYESH